MWTERKVDEILNYLVNNGTSFIKYKPLEGENPDYKADFRSEAISLLSHDEDLESVLKSITNDIENITVEFLNKKNEFGVSYITGISTGIYLPDYSDNGTYKYTLVGGDRSRYEEGKVNFDTLFDVASITKLYTLILTFKLEELGLLDLNVPISTYNHIYEEKQFQDFSINDLIKLCGEIRTEGRVDAAKTPEEARRIYETLYLFSNDRNTQKYSDFGAMVIADIISKVLSERFHKQMTFDEIMNEYLFKPLYINNTTFTPKIINVSGNANDLRMPHDEKSRLLGGVTGHAGLFTNSEGLYKLSDGLFNGDYLNQEHLDRLGEHTFEGKSKGNLGVYVKTPNGLSDSYTPIEFSNESFSHQGWTGSVAAFDRKNNIHNNILVNAIDLDQNKDHLKNNKPLGFGSEFGLYQSKLTAKIMMLYVAKKYYNKYLDVKENIEEKRMIL